MLKDIRGSSMLKQTSRFVLEVLPYLLSDCGGRCARVPLFTGARNDGGSHAKRPRSRIGPTGPCRVCARSDVVGPVRQSGRRSGGISLRREIRCGVRGPISHKNRGFLPCHAIGEGFPRLLKNLQPACLRSRAKGCPLTRPTMSSLPIKSLSDFTIGNSEDLFLPTIQRSTRGDQKLPNQLSRDDH